MLAVRSANSEPLPGYRLLEPLGKGGFGEVWKCEAPGGMLKAIKFVNGNDELGRGDGNAEQERRALENVKGLRHPFLLSIERVEIVEGHLVIVSELADKSLHDLLASHRDAGRPGIPRSEVLAYLFEAAEVLDFLEQEHGLQHLDIKPRNLFLIGRHIKVADFGLVASLSEIGTRTDALTGITPLYASPEVFDGRPTPFSDQYSLAVSYVELLTGETPYKARNSRQLMMMVATTEPDLGKLLEGDRAVVARAMSKAPVGRFASCTEFVDALARVSPPSASGIYRARTTSIEVPLGSLAGTKSTLRPPSSGLFSRESRLVLALRPAGPQGEQVLPGYHLQESLGRGPTGELWRARGPQGSPKFVRLMTPPGLNERGENPLDLLSRIDHPIAASWEVVPAGAERVALVCDAGDSSLANRFKEFRAAGHPGIPRVELMGTLGAIAQGLDELYHDTGLQHLGLTPKHLALQHGGALLLEFGLAELIWLPAGIQPATMNPRYSSGELHEGLISDACDQYSLALIFAELLVGIHPYRNLNARQLASSQLRGQPDLSLLPAADRSILAKALHADAEQRFRSCSEFLLALEAGVQQASRGTVAVPAAQAATRQGVSVTIPSLAHASAPTPLPAAPQPWRSGVDEIVVGASRGFEIQNAGLMHYRFRPGEGMEHRSWVRLAPGMARLKMAGFREQWQAKLAGESPSRWRLLLESGGASLWDRCRGRVAALCVDVTMGTPQSSNGDLTQVLIAIAPVDCAPGKGSQMLADLGPTLLTNLQAYLSIQSRREDQERFPLQQIVGWQTPLGGVAIAAQARDIGRKGMAIYSPQPIPLSAGTVSLSRPASTAMLQVPAVVRDCVPDGEGRYLVEIAFGA